MASTIVDVRHNPDAPGADLAAQVLNGLSAPSGKRTLPTLLLYDEQGLRLYDDITTKAPEYYLFAAEEEILKNHAHEIVRAIRSADQDTQLAGGDREVIIELGAGALRKTSLILKALAEQVEAPENAGTQAPVTYYALDLEKRELERTLAELEKTIGPSLKGKVEAKGMLGTYDEGISFIEQGKLGEHKQLDGAESHRTRRPRESFSTTRTGSRSPVVSEGSSPTSDYSDITPPSTPGADHGPFHLLFLGSSLGNFARGEDAAFLRSLPLRPGSGDTMLIGLDRDNDKHAIEVAYNDPKGYTKAFIMNGLRGAGRALGNEKLFDETKWDYVNRYVVEQRRHEAFFQSKVDQTINDPSSGQPFHFTTGEMIKIEESNKFSDEDAYTLFISSDLRPIQRWVDSTSRYSLWLVERPPFAFPLLSTPTETSTPFGLPTVDEWQTMWSAWDFVTLRMISPQLLFQKPIDLRHICLFYLGHIPTFLDIHLSRLLQEPHTEPEFFKTIFERGIDPNVDDPTQCHDHSEVPQKDEDWPSLSSILDFRLRVRNRLLKLYDDIQSGRRPLTRKIARVLFMTHEHEAMHAETLLYMLLQRAGSGTVPPPGFARPSWESLTKLWAALPAPTTPYAEFEATRVTLGHDDIEAEDETKPYDVNGHAFGWDNESPRREVSVPAFRIEWRPVTNGEFYEFYRGSGKDKVKLPKSWVEVDGRVQVRTMYGPVPLKTAWEWPVMTDHDDLSAYAVVKGGRLPTEAELRVFYDKFDCGYEGGANVGFRNWHPVPATTGVDGKRGHNGGVWEWTSTELGKHEGFVSSKLYPGYSADFFDGCHNVVLGGSYATIPRLSERRTVRNWYQRNYGYAWVGGRVAYDVKA